jgi:hypothetical protein
MDDLSEWRGPCYPAAAPLNRPRGLAKAGPTKEEGDLSIFYRKLTRTIAIGATVVAVGGGAYADGATPGDGSGVALSSPPATPRQGAPGGWGPNARFGPRSVPAAGGVAGTVDRISTSSFAISTSTGRTVTVEQVAFTTYRDGTSATSPSVVRTGERVLVLGMVDFGMPAGPTITAKMVIVQPADTGGSATFSAADVVPFQRGAPSPSMQVGQVPVNYRPGSGMVASGAEADRPAEAALAAYPGGIVDRVVELSDGEFEVHNVGVNWPHHIFVNHDFKVVGAD